MKHQTLWFRLGVATLAVSGVLIVVLTLRDQTLPRDRTKLPSVVGPSPLIPTR